jgi:hypothetical protein
MVSRLVTRSFVSIIISTLPLVFLASDSSAQLSEAIWTEWISFSAGDFHADVFGERASSPEQLIERFSGGGYLCEASITFPRSGAPFAVVNILVDIDTADLLPAASARFQIEFQFALQQVVVPPVNVSFVPMEVTRNGSAEIVTGFLPNPPMNASVQTEFHASGDQGSIHITDEINANNFGGVQLSSFAKTDAFWMAPDETGSVFAFTAIDIGAAAYAGRVEVEGQIDPIIEVADQLIPGTSTSYRDVYQVELSDGFWALPNRTTSFGALKATFGN